MMGIRRKRGARRYAAAALTIAILAPLLAAGAPAEAAIPPPTGKLAPKPPAAYPPLPKGFKLTSKQAVDVADQAQVVALETRKSGYGLETRVAYKDSNRWQVGYFNHDKQEIAQVFVDAHTGALGEQWTGYQVAWPMARGYSGAFGHALNAPYVWIPLALAFLFGLFDFRRKLRIVHLDLLVLLSFGISQVFFNRGNIGISVPLAYPPLIYLLARMLWIGFRGPGEGLRPSLPLTWMRFALILLIAFRVTLNFADSGVIDVGYAGVIGADRVEHGKPIYGEGAFPDDNRFGDTYGPANYYAYVPFELAVPWSGDWDDLPAAHGATVFFDLLAIFGLMMLGRRFSPEDRDRGRATGTMLAFAWAAYPYTAFASQANSNDALVGALIILGVVGFASPVKRGVALGLAWTAKFAPLVLGPLFAAGETGLAERLRDRPHGPALAPLAWFALAFALITAIMLANPAIDPGLATFYERTIKSQIDRTSVFSVWGQVDGIEWLQKAVLFAGGALAILVAFVPRRRSLGQIAALAAAVLIAIQLSADHWFYLYIPWFAGLVFAALVGIIGRDGGERTGAGAADLRAVGEGELLGERLG